MPGNKCLERYPELQQAASVHMLGYKQIQVAVVNFSPNRPNQPTLAGMDVSACMHFAMHLISWLRSQPNIGMLHMKRTGVQGER